MDRPARKACPHEPHTEDALKACIGKSDGVQLWDYTQYHIYTDFSSITPGSFGMDEYHTSQVTVDAGGDVRFATHCLEP